MRVKICGITNLEDALNAVAAGADALGFVFYEKSPRYIELNKAKEIIDQLPPFVQSVGLFVNTHAEQIDLITTKTGIDIAQIHFEADDSFYKSLQTKHIKVIRVKSRKDLKDLDSSKYYLVDAFVESYGGEGKRIAKEWFDGINCSNLVLAGGLKASNLHEIKDLGFYGVDVSSGVEESKGKKSNRKIIEFINTVNEI